MSVEMHIFTSLGWLRRICLNECKVGDVELRRWLSPQPLHLWQKQGKATFGLRREITRIRRARSICTGQQIWGKLYLRLSWAYIADGSAGVYWRWIYRYLPKYVLFALYGSVWNVLCQQVGESVPRWSSNTANGCKCRSHLVVLSAPQYGHAWLLRAFFCCPIDAYKHLVLQMASTATDVSLHTLTPSLLCT